jgi:deoxyribodipyrimidine photolyase-related protein
MKTFYTWQRKRLRILLSEDGTPVGGKWSYDELNRKKLPKGTTIPPVYSPQVDAYVEEAKEYVERNFSENPGVVDRFAYAVTHEEAQRCLKDFLKNRLEHFGPYEDAMSTDHKIMFHSVLSPYLNIGLLTPEDVIAATTAHALKHEIPLQSLEGFVRQVIGWREYMRLLYQDKGRTMRTSNYLGAARKLASSFWEGTTGLLPLDHTIKSVLETGYAHHIERLMVLGNVMTLLGVDPDEAYRWFMELFIDAYDWVMVPNIYAMALYADGGSSTTKPYVSGSHYLRTMSNYPKGEWESAWDALYWNFFKTHEKLLAKENRLGFAGMQLKRMDPKTLAAHQRYAREIIQQLTHA